MSPVVLLLAIAVVLVPIIIQADVINRIVNESCQKGIDCTRNHCCVLDATMGFGTCQPMGKTSAECHTSQPYAWAQPENMVIDFDRCPCQPGEFCATVDGGELGICSYG